MTRSNERWKYCGLWFFLQSNVVCGVRDQEISDLGKYLNKINSSDDMDRIEKINDIKRRIENNTYRIDSNELAKKIIEKTKGEI